MNEDDLPATDEQIEQAKDAVIDYVIDRTIKYHKTKSITYATEIANALYEYLTTFGWYADEES